MIKTEDRKIVVMPDEFLRLIGEEGRGVIKVRVHQNHAYGTPEQITITITEIKCGRENK